MVAATIYIVVSVAIYQLQKRTLSIPLEFFPTPLPANPLWQHYIGHLSSYEKKEAKKERETTTNIIS